MKVSVVPIGNSRGIRLPKTVLEECKIDDEVELNVEGETIVIKPVKHKPRKNWGKAFRKMHEQGEDQLIVDDLLDLHTLDWKW
ncbi:AbrB/MazE/SpoVT family DNA-binding domain-containing protein [bacterium]|nr:AbrB/MazE/SpoVT family DNA-binding domain-containing protein [bacterium]MCI0612186.1 AbrB/MazE/SpoVT family DNA-binding domain-containing protein [bacterium]